MREAQGARRELDSNSGSHSCESSAFKDSAMSFELRIHYVSYQDLSLSLIHSSDEIFANTFIRVGSQ